MNKGEGIKKDKMMIDVDDVVTYSNFFNLICEFLNKDIDIETVNMYFLQNLLGDKKDAFWHWVKDENFYKGVPLIDGVYETIDKYKNDIDFYFVSAFIWDGIVDLSGPSLRDKYEYLKENLPMVPKDRYIFINHKDLLSFDIRLDDRISNLTQGDLMMLFSAWHNRNIKQDELASKNIIRVDNWQEVDKMLARRLDR